MMAGLRTSGSAPGLRSSGRDRGVWEIAHHHALAYASSGRTELVGLVDVVPKRAEAYADAYGGRTYPDVKSLMSEPCASKSLKPV